ncbi:MAG: hypothetical protein OEZ51_14980 [Nitrospinota bacterium]|nr:hypothetical protein [Nitrospinota bacterium]
MKHRTIFSGVLFVYLLLTASTVSALPTFQFFVEDSTPKSVGFVISVSTEFDVSSLVFPEFPDVPRHVLAMVPIAKVAAPVGPADWWKPAVVIHPDEIPYRGALFFTSGDCSGTAWIGQFQIHGEFDSAFDPHVVIGDSLDPNVRTLYGADPAAPISVAMDFNSIINGNNGCNPAVRNMQAKPAILLDADLHATYPPPYKLQFNVKP